MENGNTMHIGKMEKARTFGNTFTKTENKGMKSLISWTFSMEYQGNIMTMKQIQADFFWLQGKKQGVWTSYSETGVVLKVEIYDDNKLVSITEK